MAHSSVCIGEQNRIGEPRTDLDENDAANSRPQFLRPPFLDPDTPHTVSCSSAGIEPSPQCYVRGFRSDVIPEQIVRRSGSDRKAYAR